MLLLLIGAFLVVPTGAVSADPEGDYIYSVGGDPAVATITDYIGPGGAITIPSTLGGNPTAAIGDEAFAWGYTLTSVVIPGSVITIGYAAFRHCTSLTSVVMGNGVTTIGNVLGYTENGLTNGQPYYYRVSAVNGLGEGAQSDEVTATPASVPTAPRGLQALAGDSIVALNWTAPEHAGLGALTYHLFHDDAMIWSGRGIAFIDTGLTGGRNYSYSVSASNSAGWGPNSTLVEVAPIELVPPSVTENFQVTASDGSVNISWGAPLASGTAPITGYKIYRGTNASSMTLLTTVTSGTIYQDTAVTNGQKYYYKVYASNSVGNGVSTEVLNATPQAPIAPTTPSDSTMIFVVIGAVVIGVAAAVFFLRKRR